MVKQNRNYDKKNNNKKNNGNQLSFNNLKKEIRKASKSKKHIITSPVTGNEYVIWVDTNFLPSKQEKVINNTLNFFNTDLFRRLENSQVPEYMFYINLICEFTSFGADIPNTYEAKIQALNYLFDIELFDTIINLFPVDELEKLAKKLNEKTQEIKKAIEELPDELEKIKDSLESEELKDKVEQALKVLKDVKD